MNLIKNSSFFSFTFLLLSISNAFALSCGNKLVELGDKKVEVRMKCGEPALTEKWEEKVTVFRDFGGNILKGERFQFDVEEWTYNFGSNRFLYFLKFSNDKLTNIEEGSLGFNGSLPSKAFNSPCGKMIEADDREMNVLMKCGQPTLKEKKTEERVDSILNEKENIFEEHKLYVSIEDWTYNFGPNNFIYFIKFENGKVHQIATGNYGY